LLGLVDPFAILLYFGITNGRSSRIIFHARLPKGHDVLEALQYANVGQGILAGFSILFCAMIFDRIVQGKRK
jgi:hypothetical protein